MKKALLLAIAMMGLTAGCGWGVVHPGDRAVFAYWGKMEAKCYPEGLYWYNPFTTTMYSLDVKVQALKFEKLTAASRDLQEVHADVVLNFQIDGVECHQLLLTVGPDFISRVIGPAVSEVIKAATAHFPVEKIIQERPRLKEEILSGLKVRLSQYNITVRDVSLTEFGFSPGFTKAIEAKQIEEQNVQRFEFLRLQAVKDGEARTARAMGEANANKLLAESLKQSPETLRFKELEVLQQKWNGQMPQVIAGSGPAMLLQIPR